MTLLLNHVSTGNMYLGNLTNFEQFHKSFFLKKIHILPFKLYQFQNGCDNK